MSELLDSLPRAGAHEQVAVLLARDPATHVDLDNWHAVVPLLSAMREACSHEQVSRLESRLPAAGLFSLFLQRHAREDQFRFGREADGGPATP